MFLFLTNISKTRCSLSAAIMTSSHEEVDQFIIFFTRHPGPAPPQTRRVGNLGVEEVIGWSTDGSSSTSPGGPGSAEWSLEDVILDLALS